MRLNDFSLVAPSGSSSPWSIVLAGGEGVRLRPLVQRIHPDGRPKQYAVLTGNRSLLCQTLDRVKALAPPERTVVVTTRAHARFYPPELLERGGPRLLAQPHDRGTVAGILLPACAIARREPDALVAVFPSDHFVGDEAAFLRHVSALTAIGRRHPNRILVVGARPDAAETGYGWIEPAQDGALDDSPEGGLHRVRGFWEKPSADTARACWARGGLWNTFIMVARASTLLAVGRRLLPELTERIARAAPPAGADPEPRALEAVYRQLPVANFSSDVLARCAPLLGVSRLPDVGWSDWGTPERVIATLRREGILPQWLRELAPTG